MKVYQLKILELGLYLDPVFKTKEGAIAYKNKYQNRNIIIKEKMIEPVADNYIYRIKTTDEEGYSLESDIYANLTNAQNNVKYATQEIIKEKLYG